MSRCGIDLDPKPKEPPMVAHFGAMPQLRILGIVNSDGVQN